jgi:phosphoglycolate phosphatase
VSKKIKTLLLDMDGTLIDSREDLAAAVNHVLKSLGHPLQTVDEVSPNIGNGLRRLLVDTVGPMSTETLLNAKALFEAYYSDHCMDKTQLYADVESLLKSLSSQYALAVVTNKPEAYAKKILKFLNIDSYISVVIGGETLPESKPHPAPLLEALKRLQQEKEFALMVGDGIQDIKAAQAAGVRTCLVTYGFGYHPDLLDLKPDHVIHEFKEIKEILL